jgi:hypothetical protein
MTILRVTVWRSLERLDERGRIHGLDAKPKAGVVAKIGTGFVVIPFWTRALSLRVESGRLPILHRTHPGKQARSQDRGCFLFFSQYRSGKRPPATQRNPRVRSPRRVRACRAALTGGDLHNIFRCNPSKCSGCLFGFRYLGLFRSLSHEGQNQSSVKIDHSRSTALLNRLHVEGNASNEARARSPLFGDFFRTHDLPQ